jgi:dTDP-4-amino-4,6-dideoxygalactose transaminase
LEKEGIGALIHYPIPPHLQAAYADLGLVRGAYPLAEGLADTVLSLPMGPHLEPATVDEVAAAVRRACGG